MEERPYKSLGWVTCIIRVSQNVLYYGYGPGVKNKKVAICFPLSFTLRLLEISWVGVSEKVGILNTLAFPKPS